MRSVDTLPAGLHCAADYERFARRVLPAPLYAYLAGGAGQGRAVRANVEAFRRRVIRPRLLRNITSGHTRLRWFDTELLHPILLAPVAFQQLVHPAAERATAQACAATDTTMLCSTLSSIGLEEIASSHAPLRWFQLYFQPSRDTTLALVRRAEAAGYAALVVTLDAPVQPAGLRALRAGFQLPPDCVAANLVNQPAEPPVELPAGSSRILQGLMRDAPLQEDLHWLLGQTQLPVLVKGVLRADDAVTLSSLGVSGIVVSNHGGRSLDDAPASLDVLRYIRQAVGPTYPVLFDGGVRSGADVFKALAMGADTVAIGRLQVYALAVAGALGVAHLLRLLREELEACMALAGCATLADIEESMLGVAGQETWLC